MLIEIFIDQLLGLPTFLSIPSPKVNRSQASVAPLGVSSAFIILHDLIRLATPYILAFTETPVFLA
jgi:hypothetical protein